MHMKDHYKLKKLQIYVYIYVCVCVCVYICLLLLPLHFSCPWMERVERLSDEIV